jgi:dihydroorotate dehydrogenase (NAD+) catalytic subunit
LAQIAPSETSPDSKSFGLPPKAEIPKEHSSLALKPGDFCEGLKNDYTDRNHRNRSPNRCNHGLKNYLKIITLYNTIGKMNLAVKIGKLALKSPIISASGTFGYADELKGLVDFRPIGAVVAKTITLKPREGNPPPRIYETACGVINSVGLENPGLEVFIKEKLTLFTRLPTRHVVSIGGFSDGEYVACLKRLERCQGIDAYEINLSCPNLRLKKLISQDANATLRLMKLIRKLTTKPLIIKITPEVTDIVTIAQAVQKGKADAISLVNTFFSMAINIETKKPFIGSIYGGYSGPAIKPLALYRVWKVARAVKLPVIAGGGIQNSSDALEFILAGATAVSLGTINLVYPNSAVKILEGIKAYMARKNIKDIRKIKGGLIT